MRLRDIEAAAAVLSPEFSGHHRYGAVNVSQMKTWHWLELLEEPRFVELTLPILCLADEPSLHDWNTDPRVKRHEFYVQLLEQYRVGHLLSYHTLGRELPALFGRRPDSAGLKANADKLRRALERALRTTVAAVSLTFDTDVAELPSLFNVLFKEQEASGLAWLAHDLLAAGEPIATPVLQAFLDNLAHCYHIGRYRRAEIHASTQLKWPSAQTTSQKMFVEFRRSWRDWAGRAKFAPHRDDRRPAAVFARMRLYFLFRDIARSLVSGGADLHRLEPKAADGGTKRRVRLIVIDDNPNEIRWHLDNLKRVMWENEVDVELAPSMAWGEFSAWFQRSWLDPTLRVFPDHEAGKNGHRHGAPADTRFEDVFLVDVDFEGRDRGPELVTWIRSWDETLPEASPLRKYLPAIARDDPDADVGADEKRKRAWSPRIMILTNARASESIQLSMNLGVETYLFKDRIYSLPAWLNQIPEFEALKSVRDSSADFRSIHKMPIRMLARLNSKRPGDCITGEPARIWERQWLESLPKADLHYHIGTSISPATTLTMAANTLWYSRKTFTKDELGRLIRDVWTLFAEADRERCGGSKIEWRDAIKRALKERYRRSGNEKKSASPPFEKMLDDWREAFPQFGPHDILAAVTTAIGYLEYLQTEKRPSRVPLERLKQLTGERVSLSPRQEATTNVSPPAARRMPAFDEALTPSPEVHAAAIELWNLIFDATRGDRWQGTFSGEAINETRRAMRLGESGTVSLVAELWGRCETIRTFLASLYTDWVETRPINNRLQPAPDSPDPTISLAQFVELRDDEANGNLGRYLEGAALLGAEHLQYPENIVLAALDIVDQNVRDNVLYSEIRCAPTGYCIAGLEPLAATDILCQAFDTAEVLFGSLYGRWTMTNVLLGAKRHKGPKDVKAVVELITRYLQYPYGLSEPEAAPGRPRWWRRTRVIGFDLSGREDIKAEDFHEALQPLFEYCAAITVHAGEAASAEKIWEAVYKLGARRIGHGLKLRDHRRLLEYCLTEGICLELCPISNRFTNGFSQGEPPSRDRDGELRELSPYRYPLGYYLQRGLRVAISTDNRFLHTKHRLSDEFLAGARMVNGLSRLDVLRIVKNGFYNAFLNKADLGMLLDAVDSMVFRSLAEEDERIHGPETA